MGVVLLIILSLIQAVLSSSPATFIVASISQNASSHRKRRGSRGSNYCYYPAHLYLPSSLKDFPWTTITTPIPTTPFKLTLLNSPHPPLPPLRLYRRPPHPPPRPPDYPFHSERNPRIKAIILAFGFETPFTTDVMRPQPPQLTVRACQGTPWPCCPRRCVGAGEG